MTSRSAPAPRPLPAASDFDRALNGIVRRQARAVASLLFRILTLPILVTLLCRQVPGLRSARPLLEGLSGLLALTPFALTWGRLTAARIALGRAALDHAVPADAELALAPLGSGGASARLFDAAGEGRYHLAHARRALGREAAAKALLATLAREVGPRSEWGRRAQADLAGLTKIPSKP